ncbi:GNAT family N-acetyltransferase [Alteribacillus sp. HJP-4]|uniref:GNAT family N-acetyltransferase n=1 Tax=Alteribacillus sp. HJP-4 TaxID=2775394 RepID=UPI0035CD1BC7
MIREYQPGDEQQIQALFTKVFQKERTRSVWDWKFKGRMHEARPWAFVFEENNTIIGHISLWVSAAYIEGVEKKIGLRIDTMVDPDARGRGIYKRLNEKMIAKATEEGIFLLYGFPAEKAKDLLISYTGAVHIGNISRYTLITNPAALAGAFLKAAKPFIPAGELFKKVKYARVTKTLSPGWTVEEADNIDSSFDKLAEDLKSLRPVMLKRDADFLKWRYFSHPENSYKLLALWNNRELKGFVVVKKETKTTSKGSVYIGSIVDWLAYPEDHIWDYLVTAALEQLKNTAYIQTWVLPETEAARSLKRGAFKEKDQPMPIVAHFLQETSSFMEKDSWWITQGDVDSF